MRASNALARFGGLALNIAAMALGARASYQDIPASPDAATTGTNRQHERIVRAGGTQLVDPV